MMDKQTPFFAAALLALALAAPAAAHAHGAAPAEQAVPSSHSVEQADATLARVRAERAAHEAEFADAEQLCYTKFFVNNCLDEAKEKRRVALSALRAYEVEAEHFKRQDAVDKRDADLAERIRKDEEEQARRVETPPKPHVEQPAPAAPKAAGPSLEQRQAEHDAKLKREQAKEAAEAGKRDAKAAAFAQRQAQAERKQAGIAAKEAAKADKDKRRAEAAAAKQAAIDAAAAAAVKK